MSLQILGYGLSLNSQPGIEETKVHYLLGAFALLLALMLWFFPMFVAHKLIPKTQFNDVIRLPVQETVVVACVIFSMWIFFAKVLPSLAFYIPLFAVMVHDKQPIASAEEFHFMRLAPIAIQLAVALLLAFKARTISKFLVPPQGKSEDA